MTLRQTWISINTCISAFVRSVSRNSRHRDNLVANKERRRRLFLSMKEVAAMNISAQESLRLAELLTSNDLSVRRAPTKDGRWATIGDTVCASRRSCTRIYLGTIFSARNVIRKVLEFQIGHPRNIGPVPSPSPVPRSTDRCFPVWRDSRVFLSLPGIVVWLWRGIPARTPVREDIPATRKTPAASFGPLARQNDVDSSPCTRSAHVARRRQPAPEPPFRTAIRSAGWQTMICDRSRPRAVSWFLCKRTRRRGARRLRSQTIVN